MAQQAVSALVFLPVSTNAYCTLAEGDQVLDEAGDFASGLHDRYRHSAIMWKMPQVTQIPIVVPLALGAAINQRQGYQEASRFTEKLMRISIHRQNVNRGTAMPKVICRARWALRLGACTGGLP